MIEVIGIPGQIFADHGDSGSLVYTIVGGTDWVPIGILRGKTFRNFSPAQDSVDGTRESQIFAYLTPLHKIWDVTAPDNDYDIDVPSIPPCDFSNPPDLPEINPAEGTKATICLNRSCSFPNIPTPTE